MMGALTCSCWHEIIDDQGSTIVSEYDPTCPRHGIHLES